MAESRLGKIDNNVFDQSIQHRLGARNPQVTVAPGFGLDVSVVAINNALSMALTSDPLSLIPSLGLQESAWLSVHLMANDMATTGFAPQYGQFVLNLPAHMSPEDFHHYWGFIDQYCKQIGTSITGGHTGFIEGQNSTIAGGGTFITVAPTQQIKVSSNAMPGDMILVTKSAALSTCAILALSFPKTVQNKLGSEHYAMLCDSFYNTSSLPEALEVNTINNAVSAMHDVTENGVLGAIYEMAVASGLGCEVEPNLIPVGESQKQLCSLFELDPLCSIGAGAMVMACNPQYVDQVCNVLKSKQIPCSKVGVFNSSKGVYSLKQQNLPAKSLLYPTSDPYWKAYFNALKNGWK